MSRNLTEVVGTEELKNAVVTLHPQSAVEHLHHLFVAAGGDGPDAVLAVEATRARLRAGATVVSRPAAGTDAFADMPGGPIPGGDQVAGAAAAVTGAFGGAADAVSGAFGGRTRPGARPDAPARPDRPRRPVADLAARVAAASERSRCWACWRWCCVLGLAVWLLPRGR